jgi:hypothetical protein
MSIITYFRLNIHQNGPEILGVKSPIRAKSKIRNKDNKPRAKMVGQQACTPLAK